MALPLWMQIVAKNRGQRFSPGGDEPRTFKTSYNSTPMSARGAKRRSSGRGGTAKKEYTEGPDGVIERLRDYGLSDDQIAKATSKSDGDSFDPLSPGDWLKGGGDVLTGVLDKLDIPRAAVMSGLIETTDVLGGLADKIPGVDFEPIQGTDRLRQTGVSWRDFVENFQNRVSGADVLEGNKDQDIGGVPMSNPVARAAAGFALDVGSDPLNYLGVGLADEPTKVAALFRDPAVIKTLGKEAADDAAARVLKKGTTSLKKPELAAIGRKGGLYVKTPGTGAVGRTLRVNKLGSPERYTTLAARGTKLGDLAHASAQIARLPVNVALRTIGGSAAKKGLAGNLGRLRAAQRGADDIAKPLDALVTLKAESQGRGVAKAFEATFHNRWKKLLAAAKVDGVDGNELLREVARGNPSGDVHAQGVADLLEEARVQANTIAGRDFVPQQPNYVPRVWTDEAREKFGIPQAKGKGGTRSMTRGRKYGAGTTHTFGKGRGKKVLELFDPADIKSGGLSVEEQLANFLDTNGMTQWFKTDAYDVVPDYVSKLSRQLKDEYMGGELKRYGVAEDMWTPREDKPFKATSSNTYWKAVSNIEREVKRAEDIVRVFGANSTNAKSLDWQDLYTKARSIGAKWEPQVKPALNDLMKATGEQWAQFGTGAALPADMVGVLRDIGKMSDPSAFPTVMKIHDKALNLWKRMALLSPGYHWRNTFGGTWMNWLADMDEGRYLQVERLIANDPENAPFFRGKTITKALSPINDPLMQSGYAEMKKLGVFTGGQSLNEIEAIEGGRKLTRVLNAPFKGSRKLGGSIENRLRGALFLDEYVKTGGDSAAAYEKMMKYHFDYEALGDKEATIRRLGIPFYTFTRRSVPLMVEMMVRNPGKINRYFQAKNNIERLSEEEGIVPEYFDRNFAIRLPWTNDGNQTYALPDLPLFSLVDASDPDQALGQLSPFIKTPYEMTAGKQIWKGIPLDDDPVEIPAAVKFLTPALRAMGRIRTDSEGNEVMSERDLYGIQQFLPQIGQYRRLFPTEDRYEERRMTSVLSFLFGVGTRTNTPREQANELWRRYDPYADEMDENKALGFDTETSRNMAFSP